MEMATNIGNETRGCTFEWKIENISHCWLKKGERIDSPRFIADALENTKWFVRLYPSGHANENYIAFYLRREEDCVGPSRLEVNFEIAILDKNGSILKEMTKTKSDFEKGVSDGFWEYEERNKLFVTEREVFLPNDTLPVRCTIWKTKLKPVHTQRLYAHTIFKVERRNFICKIEKFSTLKSGLRNKFKDPLVEFGLVLNEGMNFEKKLVINIDTFDEKIKYFSFKVSIADSRGKKEKFGTHEYFANDLKTGVLCTLLFTNKLMENESLYFPKDVLTLDCEYSYSDGTIAHEHWGYDIISPELKNEVVGSAIENCDGRQKSEYISDMAVDLKSMYEDQIFCDAELRTTTQTFPAHKNILSARSPVFRKMFCSDMKEKNSGHVDITDVDDDAVHQMLSYIYTDKVDDMKFDNASKLYVAADKYEILTLRNYCGLFLKDNLCPAKACDVLLLADQHKDGELKSAVQDFILSHDKEVFCNQEWKDFIADNGKLAAEMMHITFCKMYKS